MKMLLGTILFLATSLLSSAQDISGIWRGSFVSGSGTMIKLFEPEDRYKYEVQIDQNSKQFTGVTYSYKTTVFYGKASAKGTINPKTGMVMLNELRLLELKMAPDTYACWMDCWLTYTKNGDEEFLEGKYSSYRVTDSTDCGKGTVFLRKVVTSDFYKEPFLVKREQQKAKEKLALANKKASPPVAKTSTPTVKPATTTTTQKPATTTKKTAPLVVKKTPPKTPATREITAKAAPVTARVDEDKKNPTIKTNFPAVIPLVLKNRTNEVVETLEVNSNEITVSLYDNGTIDHDTVSVYLDKKIVLSRQMLTTSPLTVKLKMNEENDYHELIMVAENLGDIPPNTSLMVVTAGDKKYEVRITSTEQKNAVVIFRYVKK